MSDDKEDWVQLGERKHPGSTEQVGNYCIYIFARHNPTFSDMLPSLRSYLITSPTYYMAGLCEQTSSRSIKTQKKNSANIQPS